MTNESLADRVAEWPDNIVAQRHEISGNWWLQYLTDEQALLCKKALAAQSLEADVRALEEWQNISTAPKEHQREVLGYDPDVGRFNMHWRDDKKAWCYSWNQTICSNPTAWRDMPLPPPPKSESGDVTDKLVDEIRQALDSDENTTVPKDMPGEKN